MGTYSSMQTSWRLRADTPTEVIEAVRWLLYTEHRGDSWMRYTLAHGESRNPVFDHAFWQHSRAHQIGEDYCIHASDWNQEWWPDDPYYGFEKLDLLRWRQLEQQEDGTWLVAASSLSKDQGQVTLWCQWIAQWDVDPTVHPVGWLRVEHGEEMQLLSNGWAE